MSFFRKKRIPFSFPPQILPAPKSESKVLSAALMKVHRAIAERMGTGFLSCDNCARVQDLSVELVERYLESGWPVCCPGTANGGTMGYFRAEERKRG